MPLGLRKNGGQLDAVDPRLAGPDSAEEEAFSVRRHCRTDFGAFGVYRRPEIPRRRPLAVALNACIQIRLAEPAWAVARENHVALIGRDIDAELVLGGVDGSAKVPYLRVSTANWAGDEDVKVSHGIRPLCREIDVAVRRHSGIRRGLAFSVYWGTQPLWGAPPGFRLLRRPTVRTDLRAGRPGAAVTKRTSVSRRATDTDCRLSIVPKNLPAPANSTARSRGGTQAPASVLPE